MLFNQSQMRAISHGPGPCLVLAGPGSGKTSVIISRIRNLIDSNLAPPQHILAVTFSRASADEMKNRFLSAVPQCNRKDGSPSPVFGTFHSIFFNILKYSGVRMQGIISEKQKSDFLCSEIERYCLPYENITDLAVDLMTHISRVKNNPGMDIPGGAAVSMLSGSVPSDIFRQIFCHYEDYLSASGLIDFDDMIVRCRTLLKSRPDILLRWQGTFRFILVDEFQDISPAQYDCLRMLAGKEANIFAVGDDDQAIYGFRGASPLVMKDFLTDYPDASRITLDTNYRCAPCILHPALSVISENRERFEKNATAAKVPGNGQASFLIQGFSTRETEYARMIPLIRNYLSGGLSIAVLFRNHADSALLLSTLSVRNIPFISDVPSPDFLSHFTVLDCLAYIKIGRAILANRPEECRESLVRIINKPSRFISRDSLLDGCFSSMRNFYSSNPRMLTAVSRLYDDCRMAALLTPFAAVKYIRNVIGYDSWLASFAAQMNEDISEYTGFLNEFEEFAMGIKNFAELEAAIGAGMKPYPPADSNTENVLPVHVMTMHRSKGLEFDAVFLPETNDSVIPNKRSLAMGGLEEERRLFYVAMTRARLRLHISFVHQFHNKTALPSRFLDCILRQDSHYKNGN